MGIEQSLYYQFIQCFLFGAFQEWWIQNSPELRSIFINNTVQKYTFRFTLLNKKYFLLKEPTQGAVIKTFLTSLYVKNLINIRFDVLFFHNIVIYLINNIKRFHVSTKEEKVMFLYDMMPQIDKCSVRSMLLEKLQRERNNTNDQISQYKLYKCIELVFQLSQSDIKQQYRLLNREQVDTFVETILKYQQESYLNVCDVSTLQVLKFIGRAFGYVNIQIDYDGDVTFTTEFIECLFEHVQNQIIDISTEHKGSFLDLREVHSNYIISSRIAQNTMDIDETKTYDVIFLNDIVQQKIDQAYAYLHNRRRVAKLVCPQKMRSLYYILCQDPELNIIHPELLITLSLRDCPCPNISGCVNVINMCMVNVEHIDFNALIHLKELTRIYLQDKKMILTLQTNEEARFSASTISHWKKIQYIHVEDIPIESVFKLNFQLQELQYLCILSVQNSLDIILIYTNLCRLTQLEYFHTNAFVEFIGHYILPNLQFAKYPNYLSVNSLQNGQIQLRPASSRNLKHRYEQLYKDTLQTIKQMYYDENETLKKNQVVKELWKQFQKQSDIEQKYTLLQVMKFMSQPDIQKDYFVSNNQDNILLQIMLLNQRIHFLNIDQMMYLSSKQLQLETIGHTLVYINFFSNINVNNQYMKQLLSMLDSGLTILFVSSFYKLIYTQNVNTKEIQSTLEHPNKQLEFGQDEVYDVICSNQNYNINQIYRQDVKKLNLQQNAAFQLPVNMRSFYYLNYISKKIDISNKTVLRTLVLVKSCYISVSGCINLINLAMVSIKNIQFQHFDCLANLKSLHLQRVAKIQIQNQQIVTGDCIINRLSKWKQLEYLFLAEITMPSQITINTELSFLKQLYILWNNKLERIVIDTEKAKLISLEIIVTQKHSTIQTLELKCKGTHDLNNLIFVQADNLSEIEVKLQHNFT